VVNTELAKGDFKDEVTKLKTQNGKDILVYGGASFDSSLIKEKLIDEFYLFVNPIVIGNGKTIFKDIKEIQKLSLIELKMFDYGLVLLHYEVKKN
jgi:dihydrofolate reductase